MSKETPIIFATDKQAKEMTGVADAMRAAGVLFVPMPMIDLDEYELARTEMVRRVQDILAENEKRLGTLDDKGQKFLVRVK